MGNVGNEHDDHRYSVESSFIGQIQFIDGKKLFHDDDDAVERFEQVYPLSDGCGGTNAEVGRLVVAC